MSHVPYVFWSGRLSELKENPLTLTAYKWNQTDPLGSIRVRLYAVSYRLVRVNLDPPKGTQRVSEIHFEDPCFNCSFVCVPLLNYPTLIHTCLKGHFTSSKS